MSSDTGAQRRKGGGSRKNSSAHSVASSSSSNATDEVKDKKKIHYGTFEGQTFLVPDTLNTMEVFLPKNLSIGSTISGLCILLTAYLTFFGGYSKWLHICIFFFWRLSYDLGLGLILRNQSEHRSFYNAYCKYYNDNPSWRWVFDHLASHQLSVDIRQQKPITEYPQVFRAWLVYKNLVNIILVNDGLSYIMLGLKCIQKPDEITFLVVAQYILGLVLAVFNWFAKADAHRAIGEYCWYWGDFFFLKNLELTFDGIFELFPHPMYTVGYSLYYGYSLITRSYTMLFVSLIAHGCQLAFLFFVEEPHIKRTFPSSVPAIDESKSKLYDPKSPVLDRKENVFFLNFDLLRSGDFAVLFFSIYGLAVAFLPTDPVWSLVQVIVWRSVHWFGLGFVLWSQSTWQLWTRHFAMRNRSLYEAFAHWKATYNLSLTMNTIVFIVCAYRYSQVTLAQLINPYFMACLSLGLVLIALSVWSYTSTYEAVGEFGWFYGDFFITDPKMKQSLCYTGIYRFLNNPDCITGYAGQYGLALITQSWTIFGIALSSHILNILFLNLVEIPHMNKLYAEKMRRDAEAPFPKALKKIAQTVLPDTLQSAQMKLERDIAREARKIKDKAMDSVFELYKQASDRRRSAANSNANSHTTSPINTPASATTSPRSNTTLPQQPSSTEVSLTAPENAMIGQDITLQYSAPAVPRKQADDSQRPLFGKLSKSSYDWIGVYPIEVDSLPGQSDGKWIYVEPSTSGSVTFPHKLLPSQMGIYEARYHRNNSYEVVARSGPIMLRDPAADEAALLSPSPSPSPPPFPSDEDTERKEE